MNAHDELSFPRRTPLLSVPDDLTKTTRFQASEVLGDSDIVSASPSAASAPVAPHPDSPWSKLAARLVRQASALQALQAPTRTDLVALSAVSGALLVAAGLVVGWDSVPSPLAQGYGYGAAGAVVVLARIAMSIATLATGAVLLRLAERLSRPGRSAAAPIAATSRSTAPALRAVAGMRRE